MLSNTLKKGTTPLMVLALLETEPRHGYEISRQIELRSKGVVQVNAASLYPVLAKLEEGGLVEGRWVEKAGQRRRRYYRLTAAGRRRLTAQRRDWRDFVSAIGAVTEVAHA
jgi:PadR family transcriptional regulator, regulatory protein PadR